MLVCIYIYAGTHGYICTRTYMCICVFMYISLSTLSIYLDIHPSVCLSIYLSIDLFDYSSIHLSIYVSMSYVFIRLQGICGSFTNLKGRGYCETAGHKEVQTQTTIDYHNHDFCRFLLSSPI